MIIYEYECSQCRKHFEQKHKISEALPDHVHCPICESDSIRLIGLPSFFIKGGYMNKQFIDHTTRPASEPQKEVMEKDKHKWLKKRAAKWLRSRGCTDIRYEVTAAHLRIDVVGFRNDKPVLGIECGNINNSEKAYKALPFPIFQLHFEELNNQDADDGDENNLAGCKPSRFNDFSYTTP